MNYDVLANPTGRTSRNDYIPALIVLLISVAFYKYLVHAGRNGEWVLVTLLYPAFVLVARRLHDMGKTAWLLVVPGALFVVGIWLHMFGNNEALARPLILAALGLLAVLGAWGLVGKGQEDANKYGEAAV
jgi:uncharacterized membrane protein YhaH (DUF805 family)